MILIHGPELSAASLCSRQD